MSLLDDNSYVTESIRVDVHHHDGNSRYYVCSLDAIPEAYESVPGVPGTAWNPERERRRITREIGPLWEEFQSTHPITDDEFVDFLNDHGYVAYYDRALHIEL